MPPRKKITAKKRGVKPSGFKLPTEPSFVATSITDYITMFYGPPGVGKTTFVKDLGRVLFLSTDRGTRFVSAMRVECHKFEDFMKVARALTKPGACKPYNMIAIDHVDDFANICEDHVCDQLGIEALSDAEYGKGWAAFRKTMHAYIQLLLKLDLGVVFIAHETIKTVRTKSIQLERTMPALSKTAWNVLIPLCDLIGYCGFKSIKVGGKRQEVRVLITNPSESLYAKDRVTSRRRSERELLDGAKFIQTFEGANPNGQESTKKGSEKGRRARNSGRNVVARGTRRRLG